MPCRFAEASLSTTRWRHEAMFSHLSVLDTQLNVKLRPPAKETTMP